jgi:5-methylcytosine-specific restriction endonuclease McrA
MNSVLNDSVLVLNKNWQAIDTMNVETAFCNIVRGVATAIDTETMYPVTFKEWMKLPIRESDKSVGTVHGLVRVPTVIACVTYDQMPKKYPKFNSQNVRKRDGNRCQYTDRLLAPGEGDLDHVMPLSRGGPDTWDNVVYADRKVNQAKADKTPEEAGLKLLRKPKAPRQVPAMLLIEPRADKPEWNHFLIR